MATNTAVDGAGPTVMLNATPGNGPTINASTNVTSLTRQSAGNYTINYTTAFANAHYVLAGFGQTTSSTGGFIGIKPTTTPGTGSAQIQNLTNGGGLSDAGNVFSVIIFPI